MSTSYKSLRYTTAIAVSLVAISTANQVQAQCAPVAGTGGDDMVTCSGASAAIDLMAGNDVLTNNLGGTLDGGGGSGSIAVTKDAAGTFTLNNDGVIQSSNDGNSGGSSAEDNDGAVVFIGAGTTSAIINNDGTIQNTDSTGSRPSEGILSNSAITINNSGSITSLVDGIAVRGSGDVTINNLAGGLIESFDLNGGGFIGQIANSIEVDKSGGVVTIDNSGTIRGRTLGMRIESDISGGITNRTGGVISQTRNLGNNAAIDFSANMSGDIVNDGTIQGAASGIQFSGNTIFSGTLTNNNLIQGGSAAAIGVSFANIAGGGIVNNATGIIRRTGGGFGAIEVGTGDISGGITNAGLIEHTGGGPAIGVVENSSSAVDISGGITNSGTIRGTIGIQASSSSSGAAISGGINNSGTIEGTGGTAIEFTNVTGASPININGGRIVGDVVDNFGNGTTFSSVTIEATGTGGVGKNGQFATEGDFTVSSLAVDSGQEFTISTGNTFNTRTMTADGRINFEVDATGTVGDGATPAIGALNVTNGAITLTNGGDSVGAVVDPAADTVLMVGDEILIGTGTAAVTGLTGIEAVTNEDSLLFDFSVASGDNSAGLASSDANDLVFIITEGTTAGTAAVTSNGNSASATVESLRGITTNPELSALLVKTQNASTSEELEAIIQTILPQVDSGSLTAAQNVTGNTIRLVSDRLTTIRTGGSGSSGISSGDLMENLQVWTQIFGQKSDQDLRDGIAGYEATTRGTTIGADTEGLYDGATVGVALSYANTDVRSENATNTASDINSYNISFYGDYDLDDNTYIVGDIGYTYGDNETTRFDVGGTGDNANSDYGSHQIQARAIVARDYNPAQYEGVRVTPKVQARYIRYQNEDIKETGNAGGLNLNVESEALNTLELGVGLDVRKDYVQDSGAILSPEISVGYRYDVIGDAVETTSTFAGAPGSSFKTEGSDPDQDTLNLGFGVGYTAPSSMEFTASYDYESKDEFDSHSAFIRLAAPF